MPTYVIRVVLNTAGVTASAGQAATAVGGIGTAAEGAANKLKKPTTAADQLAQSLGKVGGLLRGGMAALGVGGLVVEIGKLSDAYTVLQNKLRTVTDGNEALEVKTQQLYEMAQKLRTEWGATAQVYTRIRRNTAELGLTEDQVMKITENLTKTIKVSGATAGETRAALLQLGQAFSSGKLAGDEFRSVAENAGSVLDVIAKTMGVTRGALKGLSTEGKITSAVLAKAFLTPNQIFNEFSESVPTFAERITQLKNAATKFVGEFAKTSILFKGAGAALGVLADHFDIVGRAIGAFAVILTVGLAAKAIPIAITAIKALTAAALANPFIALATGVAVLTVALSGLSDDTEEFNYFEKESIRLLQAQGKTLDEATAQIREHKREVALTAAAIATATKVGKDMAEVFKRIGDEARHAASFFGQLGSQLKPITEAGRVFASIQKMRQDTNAALTEAVTETIVKRTERMVKEAEEAARKAKQLRSEFQSLAGGADEGQRAIYQIAEATDVLTRALAANIVEQEEAARLWQIIYDNVTDVQSVTRSMAASGGITQVSVDTLDGLRQVVELQQDVASSTNLAATAIERENNLLALGHEQELVDKGKKASTLR